MTEHRQAQITLRSAIQDYARAATDAERTLAILSLQRGLDQALRAHLTSAGITPFDPRAVSFPELVNLVRDHTTLFRGDPRLPRLLVSLNSTRNRIAHPELSSPTPEEIARDAKQYVNVIRHFWHDFFGQPFPEALLQVAPEPQPVAQPAAPAPAPAPGQPPPQQPPSAQQPPPRQQPLQPAPLAPAPRRNTIRSRLKAVWKDKDAPRLQKALLFRRILGVMLFLGLAKFVKDAAVFTARWPEPVKYVGVALFLLAVFLFARGLWIGWKVLRQIRLKGLLILVGATYLLALAVLVLTATGSRSWTRAVWETTRDVAAVTGRATADAARSILSAPEEFRVAYVGHRRAVRVRGADTGDPAYLTPIPANEAARQAAVEETGDALPLADCPDPRARLTAPRVGQVVQGQVGVMGSATIESFAYYELGYRSFADSGDGWQWVGRYETPVAGGRLGTWDVSSLPPGLYVLRLTVVDGEGSQPVAPCEVTVEVAR